MPTTVTLRSCWDSSRQLKEELQQEHHGNGQLANSPGILSACNLVTFSPTLSVLWKCRTCLHLTRKLLQMKGKQQQKGGQALGDHHAISRSMLRSDRVCSGGISKEHKKEIKMLVLWKLSLNLLCSEGAAEPRSGALTLLEQSWASCSRAKGEDSVPIPRETWDIAFITLLLQEHSKHSRTSRPSNYKRCQTTETSHPVFSTVTLLSAFANAVISFAASQGYPHLQSSTTGGHQGFVTCKQSLPQVFLWTLWRIWQVTGLTHSDLQRWRYFPLPPYRGRGKETTLTEIL